MDKTGAGAEFLAIPTDHFAVQGPNGTHQCLVLPLLGPRVSPDLWIHTDFAGPTLRGMCYQVALALYFLHKNGICHGDFRPANILVKLKDLSHLAEDELLSLLGLPKTGKVMTESGKDMPPSTPSYLVEPADLSRLGMKYLTDKICIIDFGESFLTSSPPLDLGIPENYLPPELLFEMMKDTDTNPESESSSEPEPQTEIAPVDGIACDLWALGCTLFEIRMQVPLFYMLTKPDEVLAGMAGMFGKLPTPLWEAWTAKADYFDDDGKRIDGNDGDIGTELLDVMLAYKREVSLKNGVKKELITPEAEQKMLKDLLSRLCNYVPGERLRTGEVLMHDWFKM